MNVLQACSVIACICCIACSVISVIAPLGNMRKTLNLVIGIFMICTILVPVMGFFSIEKPDLTFDSYGYDIENTDTDYETLVLNETANNLVEAANNLLLSEGIAADNIEIGIKKSDTNSIYISRINIYISSEYASETDKIKRIISSNMSKEPVVVVNENQS